MDQEPRSAAALFCERVRASPGEEAYRYPAHGGWSSLTWRDAYRDVRELALGLKTLGLGPGGCCALVSGVRVEAPLAELAVLCAGGATTTIPPSSGARACADALSGSGSTICFVEDAAQLAMLIDQRPRLPALQHAVLIDGKVPASGWVVSLAELQARGRAVNAHRPGLFEDAVAAIPPTALATLADAPGAAGAVRGEALTHADWLRRSAALAAFGLLDHEDPLQLLWHPLAHPLGTLVTMLQLRLGFPIVVDGRPGRLGESLRAARPTFCCGPRALEDVHALVQARVDRGGWLGRTVSGWALRVGARTAALDRDGRRPGAVLALQRALADRLVLRRIRGWLGGRLRCVLTGPGPVSRSVNELVSAIGVDLLDGGALVETIRRAEPAPRRSPGSAAFAPSAG